MSQSRKKRWWIPLVIVVVAAAAAAEIAIMVLPGLLGEQLPEGCISASGRIEGREVEVSARMPGRVVELLVDEGQTVEAGHLVARLDAEELQARRREAQATEQLWQARRRLAETDLQLTRSQVETNILQAQRRLEAAAAEERRAQAAADKAALDLERMRGLHADGAVARIRLEDSELACTSASEQLEVASKSRQQAELGLELARQMRLSIDLKSAAVQDAEQMILATGATLDRIDALLAETELRSPINGVVLERVVEPQEVVAAGTPLVTLVNPENLYLKIYLPSEQAGRLRIGDKATIRADAWPELEFGAEVTFVGQRAQFTPKNVETREQRVNLMFEVKLGGIDNASRRLKPGMPAEAQIILTQAAGSRTGAAGQEQ